MLQYQNFVTVDYSFGYRSTCSAYILSIWFKMTITAIIIRILMMIIRISFHPFSPFFFFCLSIRLLSALFSGLYFSGLGRPGLFFLFGLRCAILEMPPF